MSRRLPPLRTTTPVSNLLWAVSRRMKPSVRTTLVGEFRYYLWEYPPTYTLWVANGKGFFVEVLPTLTPDEAMTAYREAMPRLVP